MKIQKAKTNTTIPPAYGTTTTTTATDDDDYYSEPLYMDASDVCTYLPPPPPFNAAGLVSADTAGPAPPPAYSP